MNKIKNINKIILILFLLIFYRNGIKIYVSLKQNCPKISVIIPIYNGGKYLNYSLKSVQNQKMKDIEIIIIDDNSSDDSLKIIHEYMKFDKRIKLIENKENRKILYSKSIGILNSKGKYIIELDQDDMFINDDAFEIIYNQSEKYYLDLLRFKFVLSLDNTIIKNVNKNINNNIIIEKQPDLKNSIFKTNFCVLWGNIFKADLYKKIIYNLWPIIINYKIIFEEDFIITFFILIYAKNCGHIQNSLYYYYINHKAASNNHLNNSEYYLSILFALNIYYDYYIDSNSKDINLILNYINWLSSAFNKSKYTYPSFFKYIFGKILTNNDLSNQSKTEIMTKFNISENCDSYGYIKLEQNKNFSEFNIKKEVINFQKNQIYKISLIITFSKYKNIIELINSINIQNGEYLEIILIYDNEKGKDFYLTKKFIQSFNNIRLIDNEINKGNLLSICKGIILSKGKYIIILEENNFFVNNDTFKNIYEVIEKDDYDIIEYNLYKIIQGKYLNLYKCKHFASLFNMTKITYNKEYDQIDIKEELLENKLIKSSFIKNIISKYKLDIINEKIEYYHNNIFNFIFESNHYKYIYISSINIYKKDIYFKKIIFNNFESQNNKLINETIFFINYIFENSEHLFEVKEKVLKEFFNVLSIIFNKFTKVSLSSIKLLNKFINYRYISKINKNKLKIYYNSLLN